MTPRRGRARGPGGRRRGSASSRTTSARATPRGSASSDSQILARGRPAARDREARGARRGRPPDADGQADAARSPSRRRRTWPPGATVCASSSRTARRARPARRRRPSWFLEPRPRSGGARSGGARPAPQAPAPAVAPAGPARDRAIAALHERAAAGAAPGSAGGRRRLARSSSEIGAAYLAEGALGRAIELLAEAYALDEENGLVLAELTLCYVRAEDFDAARFYLRRAEERVRRARRPRSTASLGDVYFGLHRLDDAVSAWSEFVRLGGQDPALLRRLARAARRARGVAGPALASLRSLHDLRRSPVSRQDLVRAGGRGPRGAPTRAQAALFGGPLAAPQVVVLYSGRAYFSLVSVPDWVSGALRREDPRVGGAGGAAPALVAVGARARARARADPLGLAATARPAGSTRGWRSGARAGGSRVREVSAAVGRAAGAARSARSRRASGAARTRAAARAATRRPSRSSSISSRPAGEGAIACVLARLARGGAPFDGRAARGDRALRRRSSSRAGGSGRGCGATSAASSVPPGTRPRPGPSRSAGRPDRRAARRGRAGPRPSSGRSAATAAAALPERA